MDPIDSKILLVEHKNAQLWLPCGGHVEPHEDPKTAASRELREELGISAEFLFNHPVFITQAKTVGHTSGHMDVSLWFVFRGRSSQQFQFDEREFYSVRWFAFDEIPYKKSDPNMKRFIKKLASLGQRTKHTGNNK